ncbi:MAG: basic amino acid ABC transporter substrate-binding protein [Planctomycetes bacterium]|nr:basic amino acid ABC transporter substrate-binding protein [Planctomycetota bacterium]
MSKLSMLVAACFLAVSAMAFSGEVIVGTNAEFMPFEYTDDDNNIIGYDIDIINAVGKAAGFEVVMSNLAFDTLVEGLESGKLDAVISGMTITEARKLKIDFSEPYYNAAQVIVVQDGTPGFTKIEDVKGKLIGVQLGTTGAGMAEEVMGENNPDLKQFRKYNEVFTELKLGRIDAIVVDLPVAQAYVRSLDGIRISSPAMSEEEYGIAVKKGNKALLDQINAGLRAIRESGEYDRITEKWFQN